jgi:D-3-phosphoglycerate dehydrogenase / 2-oxoglutarate reductase
MFRILVADDILPEGLAVLAEAADAEFDDERLSPAALAGRLGDYDAVIVRSGTPITRQMIEAASGRLRVVGRAGLALDNIDLEAATEQGILVTHTPTAYSLAAAEHTFALLLAMCRHVPAADRGVRMGEWPRRELMGEQLYGRTLGLLGLGRVGQQVAARATAFGMQVLAYDPFADETTARDLGVVLSTLSEVLGRSDFVSLHLALAPDTQRLLGSAQFALMKPGARLVNCAHGGLVDEAALYEALATGRLAGAALDVFEHEPPVNSPLLSLPNVVLAPHLGGSTRQAQRIVSEQIAHRVLGGLRGTDYAGAANLPFGGSFEMAAARPWLALAEQIGALQSHLAGERLSAVEVETRGAEVARLVKPVAAALLTGLLRNRLKTRVNYVNAPLLAARHGLAVAQARGLEVVDYANLVTCRLTWEGGQRLVAGTLFGGQEGRIVQIDEFRMDARPHGTVLIMQSRDVPGVIGAVGSLLCEYGVNIAEWRLGRDTPGGIAVSFINLDGPVPAAGMAALRELPQVLDVRTVSL